MEYFTISIKYSMIINVAFLSITGLNTLIRYLLLLITMSSFYVFLSIYLELLIQLVIKFYWMMDGMATISSRITHIINNKYQFVLFGDNFPK